MKEYSWIDRQGFGVFLESGGWRMGYHSYEESQNGLSSVKQWGIHVDSDEAFALLEGKAYLALRSPNGGCSIASLVQGDIYLVEKGEPHILILTEGTRILITENRDMSHTVNEPATAREIQMIQQNYNKKKEN